MSQNGRPFPREGGPGAAIVVGAFTLPPDVWQPTHRHPHHRLARVPGGLLAVRTAAGAWLLPPSTALWIPAGVPHATAVLTDPAPPVRLPAIDPAVGRGPGREPTAVRVDPLLSALIDHLGRAGLPPDARRRAESVVLDVLDPLPVIAISAGEPRDPRARAVARALALDPRDSRGLAAWGREVGASARTLARLFTAETGLTFGQWRERLRMQAAMPLLASDLPIEAVARRVGYGSASSFVAAFHRIVGLTPRQYFP
ncbi:helix-turn-helix transcriptional regulator [Streptomyces yaizuensis]|uniref:Helix-turn-helix domain-containing protein n=1 Tax=Streptomyces yaizuensis TaxID=2989713 RepID=A0ABQ5P312_9ACTN|nr:AraC family transcriptional regulator [Streptomyces sp. YSPA8]GLF96994.1 helix-turn-helix domain-containing protein [Streptomyces sp. YSPA8]